MSKQTIFTGAGVAIVTPMHADGSVNYKRYRELIEWQIENGTDAIITCGTTGESSTLNHEEHIAVMRTAVEQAAGRVPVISGTGSNDTGYCIELSLDCLLYTTRLLPMRSNCPLFSITSPPAPAWISNRKPSPSWRSIPGLWR